MDFYTAGMKMFPRSRPRNGIPGGDYEPNMHDRTLKYKENKDKLDKSEALTADSPNKDRSLEG